MKKFSPTRRKFIRTTVIGGALLSSPLTLAWNDQRAVLAITSKIPESECFLRGVENEISIDYQQASLQEIANLYHRLDGITDCRLIGLLDNASYILVESYVHDRGGKLLFTASYGADQLKAGNGLAQDIKNSIATKMQIETLGKLTAKIAHDQQSATSVANASSISVAARNSFVSFVAQL